MYKRQGAYRIVIAVRAGANAAVGDKRIAQGEIHWDGSAEVGITTIDALIDTVKADTAAILVDTDTIEADLKTYIDDEIIGADGDTLEDLSDQMDVLSSQKSQILNVYDDRE